MIKKNWVFNDSFSCAKNVRTCLYGCARARGVLVVSTSLIVVLNFFLPQICAPNFSLWPKLRKIGGKHFCGTCLYIKALACAYVHVASQYAGDTHRASEINGIKIRALIAKIFKSTCWGQFFSISFKQTHTQESALTKWLDPTPKGYWPSENHHAVLGEWECVYKNVYVP